MGTPAIPKLFDTKLPSYTSRYAFACTWTNHSPSFTAGTSNNAKHSFAWPGFSADDEVIVFSPRERTANPSAVTNDTASRQEPEMDAEPTLTTCHSIRIDSPTVTARGERTRSTARSQSEPALAQSIS